MRLISNTRSADFWRLTEGKYETRATAPLPRFYLKSFKTQKKYTPVYQSIWTKGKFSPYYNESHRKYLNRAEKLWQTQMAAGMRWQVRIFATSNKATDLFFPTYRAAIVGLVAYRLEHGL